MCRSKSLTKGFYVYRQRKNEKVENIFLRNNLFLNWPSMFLVMLTERVMQVEILEIKDDPVFVIPMQFHVASSSFRIRFRVIQGLNGAIQFFGY